MNTTHVDRIYKATLSVTGESCSICRSTIGSEPPFVIDYWPQKGVLEFHDLAFLCCERCVMIYKLMQ